MAETKAAPTNQTSYETDPLYQEVMQQLAAGDQAGASAKICQLIDRFPGEQALRDLLVRTQLRATVATSQPPPMVHSTAAPGLRSLVLILLAITIGLAGITGFVVAYNQIVIPAQLSQQQQLHIDELRQQAQALLKAGDWAGARKAFEELLTLVPGDPEALAAIQFANEQEVLARQYVDAVSAQAAGDIQAALDLLRQIEAENPGYRDVELRIRTLEEKQALESAWQQSESLIQAGDWASAITALTHIRSQNPEFRRSQVEEQLSRVYAQMARELIAKANGSTDTLRQAVDYLDKALALRPTQQDLLDERKLAAGFVAGADAFDQQNWSGAVDAWEPVYAMQPDYQNGVLQADLNKAYPQAARQLIAEANGNVAQLSQAIGYLDRALAVQPGNQELIDERRLVIDFVAGADAFDQAKWSLAIAHWGAIYAVQPNYQNGILEDRLREACANAPEADRAMCPP